MIQAVSSTLAFAVMLCWTSVVLAGATCVDVVNRQGREVAGVSVTFANWTRYTNRSGQVCFQNIPPGRYQILLRIGEVTGTCDVRAEQTSVRCQLPMP